MSPPVDTRAHGARRARRARTLRRLLALRRRAAPSDLPDRARRDGAWADDVPRAEGGTAEGEAAGRTHAISPFDVALAAALVRLRAVAAAEPTEALEALARELLLDGVRVGLRWAEG